MSIDIYSYDSDSVHVCVVGSEDYFLAPPIKGLWGFENTNKIYGYQSFRHGLFRKERSHMVMMICRPRGTGKNAPKKNQTLSEDKLNITQKRSTLSSHSAYHVINIQSPDPGLHSCNSHSKLIPDPKQRQIAYHSPLVQSAPNTAIAATPQTFYAGHSPNAHASSTSPPEHKPRPQSYLLHLHPPVHESAFIYKTEIPNHGSVNYHDPNPPTYLTHSYHADTVSHSYPMHVSYPRRTHRSSRHAICDIPVSTNVKDMHNANLLPPYRYDPDSYPSRHVLPYLQQSITIRLHR